MQCIIRYCLDNMILFKWINENNIIDYINTSIFTSDENLIQLNQLLNGIKKNKNKIN